MSVEKGHVIHDPPSLGSATDVTENRCGIHSVVRVKETAEKKTLMANTSGRYDGTLSSDPKGSSLKEET